MTVNYRYRARLERVIDGDTVSLIVDLGFKVLIRVYCRLARIDSSELNSTDPVAREKAQAAKRLVEEILASEPEFWLDSKRLDLYGRAIGEIEFSSGVKLSDLLLAHSHLYRPY